MTEFVSTVNETSGGDFSSLTSWEAAIQADLTAAASKVFAVSSIANSGIADGEACTGQTSGATGTFKHLKADDSQCFILVLTGTFQAEVIEQDGDTSKTVTTSDAGAQITRATAQVSSDSELTDSASINGWTTDSTHDILITTISGQSFQDHADVRTNKLDYNATNGAAITTAAGFNVVIAPYEVFTKIEKLQLKATATTSIAVWALGDDIFATDCILQGARDVGHVAQTSSARATWTNCFIRNVTDGAGADGLRLVLDSRAVNCTVVKASGGGGNGVGIESTTGDNSDAVNCCSFGFGTDWAGTWDTANSNNNASDGTNSPGASAQDSCTYADEFESATDDWRAKDSGGDPRIATNGDPAGDPANDISGQARDGSTPTIGCWEISAAAQTITASLDAAVQAQQTLAASLNAAIQQTGLTKTANLDAGVAVSASQIASLDAALQTILTANASLDAAVESARQATASLDAAFQDTAQKTTSLDAALAVAQTAQANLDAVTQAAKQSTVSLDGVLQAARQAAANLDAVIQAAATVTTSLEAALQKTLTVSASLDASITGAAENIVTAALDAALQAMFTVTLSLDAALRVSRSAEASLDAAVAVTNSATVFLDAAIAATKSSAVSLDAVLQGALQRQASLDAAIKILAQTVSASIDAALAVSNQVTASLDGVLARVILITVGLNATLRDTLSVTASLDANISGAVVPFSPGSRRTYIIPGRGVCSIPAGGRRVVH